MKVVGGDINNCAESKILSQLPSKSHEIQDVPHKRIKP